MRIYFHSFSFFHSFFLSFFLSLSLSLSLFFFFSFFFPPFFLSFSPSFFFSFSHRHKLCFHFIFVDLSLPLICWKPEAAISEATNPTIPICCAARSVNTARTHDCTYQKLVEGCKRGQWKKGRKLCVRTEKRFVERHGPLTDRKKGVRWCKMVYRRGNKNKNLYIFYIAKILLGKVGNEGIKI